MRNRIKNLIKQDKIFAVPNERSFLYNHLVEFAQTLKGKKILDIGAGRQQYRSLFEPHNTYEACDLDNSFYPEKKPDIIASVYDIPRENGHYDVVLLLQVLEHLEFPVKGLREIHRVLKKDGVVYLSTPQAAGDHFEPYHFFNFTQYGLQSVLSQSGFRVQEHQRLAGMFNYVGNRIWKLGSILESQYRVNGNIIQRAFAAVFKLMCYGVGRSIALFDFLDKKKHYCIGHIVVARKVEDHDRE